MSSVFFHEDDYCRVELLPIAARGFCLVEMGHIGEFARAHRDGAGFTDLYVRENPPLSLASLSITLAELHAVVEPLLPRFTQVLTGYSSYREPCSSVASWGVDDMQAVFANIGKGDVVESVWLALQGVPAEHVERWCQMFQSVPRASEMLVADWSRGQVIPLTDVIRLTAYLRSESAEHDGQ